MKSQINDINVASNEETINTTICPDAPGLSFKFLSQTMAGHTPTQPLPGFPERQGHSSGPNWPLVATTLGFTSNNVSPPRRALGKPPSPPLPPRAQELQG